MRVNLKKLGAVVAGATVLASSAAFGALMFGDTTLVDDNGQPVAKVVVGERAAVSDGVAAALIAAELARNAYKTQTLTAELSGEPACSVEGAPAAGDVTCNVTNERVRLKLTVPGAALEGTWTGDNLIGDFIHRRLIDRVNDSVPSTDTDVHYPMGSDVSENANPFTDGTGSALPGAPTETRLFRIDGSMFSPFEDFQVVDTDGGQTYTERQYMWLHGNNKYSSTKDDVIGFLDLIAYTVRFDGPGSSNVGVLACTQPQNNDYSFCVDSGDSADLKDATETHRVRVRFLGSEWIISELRPPNSDPNPATAGDGLTNENNLVEGGSVKLAKEAVGGIVNQGESLEVDDLRFQLDDLEAHGDTVGAIISVLDANGNILEQDVIRPGQTREFNINGRVYRFHVYQVAPGYTFGAKWADVAIFSAELECRSGEDLNADEDNNPNYKCVLGWKNYRPQSAVADGEGANPEDPDALRTIVIFSDEIDRISSSGEDELLPGDYLSIVQDPEAWRLQYQGLTLTSEDRESLRFQIKTTDKTLTMDSSSNFGPDPSNNLLGRCIVFAPYILVTSSDDGLVFETTGRSDAPSGTLSDSEFIIAVNTGGDTAGNNIAGAVCDTQDASSPDTPNDAMDEDSSAFGWGNLGSYSGAANTGDVPPGSVFMRVSGDASDYGFLAYPLDATANEGRLEVLYREIGDGDAGFGLGSAGDGGVIRIVYSDSLSGTANDDDYQPGAPTDGLVDLLSGVTGGTYTGGLNGDTANMEDAGVADFLFAIAEKAGEASSNDFVDYFIFGIDRTSAAAASDATFDFDSAEDAAGSRPLTSDNEEILYVHAWDGGPTSGPVDSGVELVEEGYISERGSVFRRIDADTVEFDMAHKLGKARWFLSSVEAAGDDASSRIMELREGESETFAGVTVEVLSIDQDLADCTAGGAGVSCSVDTSGLSAVILPANAPSVDAALPYQGSLGDLVILDRDAAGVGTLIAVGGDRVNSVTAELLQDSAVDWTAERKVVREVVQGSKIVVAGAEAQDTLEAARDFISQLRRA